MNHTQQQEIDDKSKMKSWLAQIPDTHKVAGFVSGPGIQSLDLKFDIVKLQEALETVTASAKYVGAELDQGFGAISLTQRPGIQKLSGNDISGQYWLRADNSYTEEQVEEPVDEAAFSEFVPEFAGTYFEYVHHKLSELFPIGRMRILSKAEHCCNHWHRDPEPRLHIPIISNPGSLFVVNNHCTHLPADGSVYFTDTRGYHSAMNGGFYDRTHIVVTLPI
ncbi:MAG: hypothetical protein V7784_04400 [Oceanospirillaceae bacterium]